MQTAMGFDYPDGFPIRMNVPMPSDFTPAKKISYPIELLKLCFMLVSSFSDVRASICWSEQP
jgi:hypothetical protein